QRIGAIERGSGCEGDHAGLGGTHGAPVSAAGRRSDAVEEPLDLPRNPCRAESVLLEQEVVRTGFGPGIVETDPLDAHPTGFGGPLAHERAETSDAAVLLHSDERGVPGNRL